MSTLSLSCPLGRDPCHWELVLWVPVQNGGQNQRSWNKDKEFLLTEQKKNTSKRWRKQGSEKARARLERKFGGVCRERRGNGSYNYVRMCEMSREGGKKSLRCFALCWERLLQSFPRDYNKNIKCFFIIFRCWICFFWVWYHAEMGPPRWLSAIKVTSGEYCLGSQTLSIAASCALILIITLDLGQESIFIMDVGFIVQKVH